MEKLEIKGNIILWNVGTRKWLINYEELTKAYLTGKHPHTKKELSTATQNKLLSIIRAIAGDWFISVLKKIKNYRSIPLNQLQQLKTSGIKLGSGKYATVYLHNGNAVKVINHRHYKHLPRIDGALEAKVLTLLKNRITYPYLSPNIINMHQYTPDSKTDYIVLEKLDETFWTYLQNDPKENIVKGIILQILFTLTIIQHVLPGFRHNDLKVDNILLDLSTRKQRITLRYKNYFWVLPPETPLVKMADFDYACLPGKCENPKVGTDHACSFGCTTEPSKVYDLHLFLNSLYSYRKKVGPIMTAWLQQQLPEKTRGNDNTGVRFGRLKNPKEWDGIIHTPLEILLSRYFSEFRTIRPTYPIWGLKN